MLLTMSAGAAILFFLLIFEDQNLFVFPLGFQSARYRGSLYARLTDKCLIFGLYQKNILELHRSTRLRIQLFDADNITFRNAVLLSAAHYHCVHGHLLGRNRRFNQEAEKKAITNA
jgi:hypothetical protein